MNDEELSRLIRSQATRHQASDRLRAAVRTQATLHTARGNSARPAGLLLQRWRGALAGFATGAALTLALMLALPPLWQEHRLPDELVAAHVRALKLGPLVEVASSDRHNVKPWYQGRLDYAPSVPDLSAAGFPLLGGRVERATGTAVAALAYGARQHVLSVYTWPADGPQAPQREQRRGFQALHWAEGGMQVWVVSDQDAAEVERFAQAWRAQVAAAR